MDMRDPDQPPGAVVEVRADGTAIRNDRKQLRPASLNSWYVLATIYGEQTGEEIDWELHARNRRIWNGWACAEMEEAVRAQLAETLDLPVADLAPWTDVERETVDLALRDRLGKGAVPPSVTDKIDLARTHFAQTVVWEKCGFCREADFYNATCGRDVRFGSASFGGDASFLDTIFRGDAKFGSATFTREAIFFSATFAGNASFDSATFGGEAYFASATFGGEAYFASATFDGNAIFHSATFNGYAAFDSATFHGFTSFSSSTFGGHAGFISTIFRDETYFGSTSFGMDIHFLNTAFGGTTNFETTNFATRVPHFQQAQMHQDTVFSTGWERWPGIPLCDAREPGGLAQEVGEAKTERPVEVLIEESKRNYGRLRQIMTEMHRPDDAHFFLRQEMRCKAELEGSAYKLLIRAYGYFSEYGYSVWKPLLWLVTIWAFGAAAFAGWAMQVPDFGPGPAVAVSFGNCLPFLGLNRTFFDPALLREMPAALKFLSGLQTVLAMPLLFLFGLGLHTRFRLK